ncbi:hypothetical protein FZEAL_4517 [Fusarium zealandicum]|uniref:Uncharacterized protein n=1 Tax=Fusarium zealandicum TaxID=1053134 RepID=A0A8H4ULI7_9HYPO|nr:hypothetical protein FZEAL_4517 [Fusarium zealandicum]
MASSPLSHPPRQLQVGNMASSPSSHPPRQLQVGNMASSMGGPVSVESRLSQQLASMVAEADNLRHICASQQREIRDLRAYKEWSELQIEQARNLQSNVERIVDDKSNEVLGANVLANSWKTDCQVFKDALGEARNEIDSLNKTQAAAQKENQELHGQLLRHKQHINKLVALVYNKTRVNRICGTAIRAAYKLMPGMGEQETFKRLLERADRATREQMIEQEVREVLKGAGIEVSAAHLRALMRLSGPAAPATAQAGEAKAESGNKNDTG